MIFQYLGINKSLQGSKQRKNSDLTYYLIPVDITFTSQSIITAKRIRFLPISII